MNDIITIVSGLPRSGTSMMMRMLELGGMEVLADNVRKADEDNPLGYYEFEKVKRIKQDSSWLDLARGKVFKMVSLLLKDLPLNRSYNIIFMLRDTDEMIASQRKMLERKGVAASDEKDAEMKRLFELHLKEMENWLFEQKNMRVLYMNFNEIVKDADKNIATLNQLFYNRLDAGKMCDAVKPSLYRNRRGASNSV